MRIVGPVLIFGCAMLMGICASSCNDDAQTNPVQSGNTIMVEGRTTEIQSVFAGSYNGYKTITLLPNEETDGDYVQVMVSPALLNQSFYVMTEQQDFTIISRLEDLEFTIAPKVTGNVKAGECRYDIDGEKAALTMDITLENGRRMTVHATGEATQETDLNEYIAANGIQTHTGTAFIESFPESARLYFTPDRIPVSDELWKTNYFVMFQFVHSLADGSVRDVTALEYDELFFLEYWDNRHGIHKKITTDGLDGATGTLCVKQHAESDDSYNVELHFRFGDGTRVDLKFNNQLERFK